MLFNVLPTAHYHFYGFHGGKRRYFHPKTLRQKGTHFFHHFETRNTDRGGVGYKCVIRENSSRKFLAQSFQTGQVLISQFSLLEKFVVENRQLKCDFFHCVGGELDRGQWHLDFRFFGHHLDNQDGLFALIRRGVELPSLGLIFFYIFFIFNIFIYLIYFFQNF